MRGKWWWGVHRRSMRVGHVDDLRRWTGGEGALPLYSSLPSPMGKRKVGWGEAAEAVEPGWRSQVRVRDGVSTLKPPVTP